MTRHRIGNLGIITLLLVTILAGCGGGSDPAPTVTAVTNGNVEPSDTPVAATDNVEPLGEAPGDVVIPTNAPLPPAPTSTLYAVDQPTPTVLAGASCSYENPNKLVFQDFERQRAEAHACVEEFVWPSGYEIDPEKLAFEGAETGGGGVVGEARSAVAFNNMCAWGTAWLDATKEGDHESADRALDYMLNILPYAFSQDVSDPTTAFSEFLVPAQRASLGDPSLIAEMVNGFTCLTYERVRSDP